MIKLEDLLSTEIEREREIGIAKLEYDIANRYLNRAIDKQLSDMHVEMVEKDAQIKKNVLQKLLDREDNF